MAGIQKDLGLPIQEEQLEELKEKRSQIDVKKVYNTIGYRFFSVWIVQKELQLNLFEFFSKTSIRFQPEICW